MKKRLVAFAGLGMLAVLPCASWGQHLIWLPEAGKKPYTCLYGEIQVLATGPTIYYCGCNWWPGNSAGGYCGIQDGGDGRHLVIFSIWDTSPTLHPVVTEADPRTKHNRFGGEGEGAHTHLDYNWPLGRTFRYFVSKRLDASGNNTLARMYFYDEGLHRWVHEATISSPNDGHVSVETFGGMLNSFLENWSGQARSVPKLALYRLWVGTSPRDLASVNRAWGDGAWGTMNGAFYLAEGDAEALAAVIRSKRKPGASWTEGSKDRTPLVLPPRRLPAKVTGELERLPKAPPVPQAARALVPAPRPQSIRYAGASCR